MFNIKTLNKISPSGLSRFDGAKYTYGDDIENPDAIMVRSAKMHDMAFEDRYLHLEGKLARHGRRHESG